MKMIVVVSALAMFAIVGAIVTIVMIQPPNTDTKAVQEVPEAKQIPSAKENPPPKELPPEIRCNEYVLCSRYVHMKDEGKFKVGDWWELGQGGIAHMNFGAEVMCSDVNGTWSAEQVPVYPDRPIPFQPKLTLKGCGFTFQCFYFIGPRPPGVGPTGQDRFRCDDFPDGSKAGEWIRCEEPEPLEAMKKYCGTSTSNVPHPAPPQEPQGQQAERKRDDPLTHRILPRTEELGAPWTDAKDLVIDGFEDLPEQREVGLGHVLEYTRAGYLYNTSAPTKINVLTALYNSTKEADEYYRLFISKAIQKADSKEIETPRSEFGIECYGAFSSSKNRTKVFCIKDKIFFAINGDGQDLNSQKITIDFAKLVAGRLP